MLRRIDIKGSWRSLNAGFWPDDLPLGHKTVIYGHNGSGKSTLSELLLSLSEGRSEFDVVWEDENQQTTTVSSGGASPSPLMAVFTRRWVDSNLAAFLDGESASAIVTLGEAAIGAKEEEERLEEEIERLRKVAFEANDQRKEADQKVDALAHKTQDRIVSELKEFDYDHFTKSRYSMPKVKEYLRSYAGDFPDADAHAVALKRLGDETPAFLSEIVPPMASVAAQLDGLAGLWAETPIRAAIANLEGDSEAQSWVERGLVLHEELDRCLFCAGQFNDARRDQLARHFDESWLEIRGRAERLLGAVLVERDALTAWQASLPASSSLAGDLQSVYEEAAVRVKAEAAARISVLDVVASSLNSKVDDPGDTPTVPDWSVLASPLSITVLSETAMDHNELVRRHSLITDERRRVVLDHIIGSQSQAFTDSETQLSDCNTKSDECAKAVDVTERRLVEVRAEQFTTKDMADALTDDLARVYGKNHLRIVVTGDGKSYTCRRGTEAGTNLSAGERTTLALLYFLRKLEDEQVAGSGPSERIVVVDDPSSSLDREALFATHQWLIDSLDGFGQYIVLTHDFGLLRLFINSQKNAWGKSRKRIDDGVVDEIRFPTVAFLEMFAAEIDGIRQSKVGELPRFLRTSTSEYAYLFSMVMAGVAESEDHERLFLLPNAARRVLEIFASYKAPHCSNFREQLEALGETVENQPFRDVYDFCNRYSHGEGGESIDVLDARTVHEQIRRCMQFLKAVDEEHFLHMCTATDIGHAVIG